MLRQRLGNSIIIGSNAISDFSNASQINASQISILHNFKNSMVDHFSNFMSNFSVNFITLNYAYGTFIRKGRVVPANTIMNFSSMDNHTGLVYVYKVNIKRANPDACIYVNLESVPFCSNATTPSRISVPVINGRYALTGNNWYPLNITFKANLLGTNIAPFSFSIIDATNNTVLTSANTMITNSINVNESFRVPIQDSIEISFNTAGNANYSAIKDDPITTPTGILEYVPITLTNSQSAGVPNPFQQMITVNSLEYQTYEASNLQNIEFFYANGTITPSWLESGNSNTDTNTIYWLKVPGNFLPASSSNTLYMGFVSTSTNLFSNTITGEAPPLSSPYAAYDNGQSVFNIYGYFNNTLDGWNPYIYSGSFTPVATASGAQLSNAASNEGEYISPQNQNSIPVVPTILEFSWSFTGGADAFASSIFGEFGKIIAADSVGATDGGQTPAMSNSIYTQFEFYSGQTKMWIKDSITGSDKIDGTAAFTSTGGTYFSYMEIGTGMTSAKSGYVSATQPITAFDDIGNVPNANNVTGTVPIGHGTNFTAGAGSGGATSTEYLKWLIGRSYPPNGIMPSVTFGSVDLSGSPSITVSPSSIIYGQTATITAQADQSTDYVKLYINNNLVAGPIQNSITYTFNGIINSPGSYTINAIDTNTLLSSIYLLTESKATPLLSMPNFPASFIYTGTPVTVTANIVTINNQLTANDYVNGILESSFNTQNTFQESSAGSYSITTNTLGNGNYLPASITEALIICPAASSIPVGIKYYACARLGNSQSSGIPNPFQQMLTVNSLAYSQYENSGLTNAEFFYQNGTVLPSWLESGNSNTVSNTVYWLNLTGNLLPAFSSNYIYIGFVPESNTLMNGNNIGEAAQLSSTYGQYDNIANIMDSGLLYQLYFDSSGTCNNAGYQGQVYYTPILNGITINSCTTFVSSTPPFTTPNTPFTSNVDGTVRGNVILNYQEGYSGGAAYPNPPISNNADSWILKAIGFVQTPNSAVTFSEETDDGMTIGYSSSGNDSTVQWLGGTSNPNNIASSWVAQGAAIYSGTASTPGDYRLESDYFEDGGGAYTALWSNSLVNYYHPATPPNDIMPNVNFTSAVAAPSQNTCTFTVSNTAINFGPINPGTDIATQNAILITNTGNTASNVLLDGSDWAFNSNTFSVTNTVWSWSSGVAYASANGLTSTTSDTRVTVGSSNQKNIFFGVGTPSGQAPGTYSQTINIISSC